MTSVINPVLNVQPRSGIGIFEQTIRKSKNDGSIERRTSEMEVLTEEQRLIIENACEE
jgi:hypothetical protein